ncbi:MAG: hypothetical protein ACJ8CR_27440 [Roseiflexaceae bacterium]
MSKKTIEKNLKRVLLDDAPFALALFDYELKEHIEEYLQSKHEDNDRYFFAITEHTNDVAMLLIDEHDTVHINEEARVVLRVLWRDAYPNNIQRLIPKMVQDLNAGYLFAAGVKVVGESSETGAPDRRERTNP